MKTAFALGVLAVCLVPSIALVQADVQRPAPPPVCVNTIVHEPLFIYEVLGSSLIGPFDSTLTVYADGTLKLADAYAIDRGQCVRTQTTPRIVNGLQQALFDAGGFALCDDTQIVTDVPLHTLTLLNAAENPTVHTFSYWVGDGDYAAVDALLANFVAEQFPANY